MRAQTSKKASRFRLQLIDQTRMPFPGTARAYLNPYRTVLGGDSAHLTGEELRPMKLITAIIKPFKLEDVRKAVGDVASRALRLPRFEALGGNAATPKSIGAPSTSSSLCQKQR